MVTGVPVWNTGSGSPQKAVGKTDFDHGELGMMPVNTLERATQTEHRRNCSVCQRKRDNLIFGHDIQGRLDYLLLINSGKLIIINV